MRPPPGDQLPGRAGDWTWPSRRSAPIAEPRSAPAAMPAAAAGQRRPAATPSAAVRSSPEDSGRIYERRQAWPVDQMNDQVAEVAAGRRGQAEQATADDRQEHDHGAPTAPANTSPRASWRGSGRRNRRTEPRRPHSASCNDRSRSGAAPTASVVEFVPVPEPTPVSRPDESPRLTTTMYAPISARVIAAVAARPLTIPLRSQSSPRAACPDNLRGDDGSSRRERRGL